MRKRFRLDSDAPFCVPAFSFHPGTQSYADIEFYSAPEVQEAIFFPVIFSLDLFFFSLTYFAFSEDYDKRD